MKTALFLVRRAPYAGLVPGELLDSLLVAAAFDVPITVLFLGTGVWQLAQKQAPAPAGLKSLSQQLSALPMYDVDRVFADQDSLERYGLTPPDLVLPVTPRPPAAIRELIDRADMVFND